VGGETSEDWSRGGREPRLIGRPFCPVLMREASWAMCCILGQLCMLGCQAMGAENLI
jgi:hypothetical protein